MYVHIHYVFASNELISVTILLLHTDSSFRLSLLMFLSRDKSTFSHRDFVSLNFTYSYFLLCIAYFSFHFTYTTCLQIKFHSLPYRPFKVLAFPEQCTEGVTLHSVTREECFWKPFQMLLTTTVLSDDSRFPCDLDPLRFQESGSFSLKTSSEN